MFRNLYLPSYFFECIRTCLVRYISTYREHDKFQVNPLSWFVCHL
jgi:hypothetical protein